MWRTVRPTVFMLGGGLAGAATAVLIVLAAALSVVAASLWAAVLTNAGLAAGAVLAGRRARQDG